MEPPKTSNNGLSSSSHWVKSN